jgi:hypothetical protein
MDSIFLLAILAYPFISLIRRLLPLLRQMPYILLLTMAATQESDQTFSAVSTMSMMV